MTLIPDIYILSLSFPRRKQRTRAPVTEPHNNGYNPTDIQYPPIATPRYRLWFPKHKDAAYTPSSKTVKNWKGAYHTKCPSAHNLLCISTCSIHGNKEYIYIYIYLYLYIDLHLYIYIYIVHTDTREHTKISIASRCIRKRPPSSFPKKCDPEEYIYWWVSSF